MNSENVETGIRQCLFCSFSLFISSTHSLTLLFSISIVISNVDSMTKYIGFSFGFVGFWFTWKYFKPLNDNSKCENVAALMQLNEMHINTNTHTYTYTENACKRSKFMEFAEVMKRKKESARDWKCWTKQKEKAHSRLPNVNEPFFRSHDWNVDLTAHNWLCNDNDAANKLHFYNISAICVIL